MGNHDRKRGLYRTDGERTRALNSLKKHNSVFKEPGPWPTPAAQTPTRPALAGRALAGTGLPVPIFRIACIELNVKATKRRYRRDANRLAGRTPSSSRKGIVPHQRRRNRAVCFRQRQNRPQLCAPFSSAPKSSAIVRPVFANARIVRMDAHGSGAPAKRRRRCAWNSSRHRLSPTVQAAFPAVKLAKEYVSVMPT